MAVKKNKSGRPFKLTAEIRKKIIDSIRASLPYEQAAHKARICEKTLYNWLNKGREDMAEGVKSEWSLLLQDIKETEADKMLATIKKVDNNVERWQASAWLLERRWREHFGSDAGIIAELQQTFNELKAKFEAQENKS